MSKAGDWIKEKRDRLCARAWVRGLCACVPKVWGWLGKPEGQQLPECLRNGVVRLGVVLLAAMFAAAFALSLWAAALAFGICSPATGTRWEEIRNSLIVAVAGLGAPFLVWRTWLAARQTALNQETHYTDLFTKAVEQLGADKTSKRRNEDGAIEETTEANIEVRMGAIFALERIARESQKDYGPIVETLSAYIVHNTQTAHAAGVEKPADRPDIMAALRVLCRRKHEWDTDKIRPVLDHGCFQGATLLGLKFINFSMCDVDFQGANFTGHDCENETLIYKSEISRSNFYKAILSYLKVIESKVYFIKLYDGEDHKINFFRSNVFMSGKINGDGLFFRRANVCGSIAYNVNYLLESDNEYLNDAFGDAATQIPEELERPAHWAKTVLTQEQAEAAWKEWLSSRGTKAPDGVF